MLLNAGPPGTWSDGLYIQEGHCNVIAIIIAEFKRQGCTKRTGVRFFFLGIREIEHFRMCC